MRNDMFNWLLRKKQTTPLVPEVESKAVHPSVEAEISAEASAPETVATALLTAKPEIVEPVPSAMEMAPGTVPAPAVEVPEAVIAAPEPESVAAATAAEPTAAEPASSAVPELTGSADQPEEAPAATPPKTCERPRQPFTTGVSRPKPLLVLQTAVGEIDLRADLEVVEHSGRQARTGKLIAVRADGRRLLAKLGGAGRIRAYTLRRDGIYRLEGANDARAPVLELAN